MGAAIEISNLVKTYKSKNGPINVVDNIDLRVEEGEIFGFLGPNGAGKTTTIKILLGIIYATSGKAQVLGKDVGDIAIHHQIAYLPEKPYYYEHMTGMEILEFYGALFGIKDKKIFQGLLEKVNLAQHAGKTISQYSKGMQQRIGLAQSLINNPKLLFLDEPTAGLDPIAHKEIRDLILSFREEGKTVFISSHELSDVELICDRVAIINHGVIRQYGRLDQLLAGGRIEINASGVPTELAESFKHADHKMTIKAGELMLDMPDTSSPNDAIEKIIAAGGLVKAVLPRRKRLEDLFVETVTGQTPDQIEVHAPSRAN